MFSAGQLETFKRQLMQSLSDDSSSVRCWYLILVVINTNYLLIITFGFLLNMTIIFLSPPFCFLALKLWQQAETIDIGTCDQTVPKTYSDMGTSYPTSLIITWPFQWTDCINHRLLKELTFAYSCLSTFL